MRKETDPIAIVKRDLLTKYDRETGHVQPMLQGSMRVAYAKGVQDALEWVRDFNEVNREKSERAP